MLRDLASRPDSRSAGNVMSCVYKIRNFVTVFTTGWFWSLSWARWIRSTLSGPVSQRRNLYNLNNCNWPGLRSWYSNSLRARLSRVWFPLGAMGFSFHQNPDPGGHPAFFDGYRDSSRRIQRPWLSFHHPPLSSAEVKTEQSYTEHPSVRHDTLRRENYQLHLRLPSCYFPLGFPTILLYAF